MQGDGVVGPLHLLAQGAVAEQFGTTSGMTPPVVESTGTGGGMEQFCKGVGAETPDITNASRRIKKSEFENCQKNGVKDIIEIQVGIDGLALAQSNKGAKFALSTADVYKALAANPFGKPQTAKLFRLPPSTQGYGQEHRKC